MSALRGRAESGPMVWWWSSGWTSGQTLTIATFLYALRVYRHAITTEPKYQRQRRSRKPYEAYRFCDARFAEAR